jgi:hypothetical protein
MFELSVIEAMGFVGMMVGAAVEFTVAVDRQFGGRPIGYVICELSWIGACIGIASIAGTIIGMVRHQGVRARAPKP